MKTRRIVQLIFFTSSIYLGLMFVRFLSQLKSGHFDAVKPGGVEAFLPISALAALKRLVVTGNYDWVHPAGLSLFIIFIIISFLFRRSFCGYVCPVGFVSEIVSVIGLGKGVNRYVGYVLSLVKYGLFAFFAYIILLSMPVSSIESFLSTPYNKVADAKMLDFFTSPGTATVVFVIVVVALTFIFKGVWCKYLCPYGALHSVVAAVSPFVIRRDASACVNCMKCTEVCPMDIKVHKAKLVLNPDCIGCHDCLAVRHNEKCLQTCKKDIRAKYLPYAVFGVAAVLIIAAMAFGLWNSNVPAGEYAFWLSKLGQLSH
jgi:polyferredoxin